MVYKLWIEKDRKTLMHSNFQGQVKGCASIVNRGRKGRRYLEVYCGFDIETTTTETHHGFMYHWQMSINDIVIFGTRWYEFVQIIEKLKKDLILRKTTRLIIWVANLGFEFQFMRKNNTSRFDPLEELNKKAVGKTPWIRQLSVFSAFLICLVAWSLLCRSCIQNDFTYGLGKLVPTPR